MDLHLRGKTALVTGASAGIGRGIALALAAEGVRVAVTVRRSDKLNQLADEAVAAGGTRPLIMEQDMMAADAASRIAAAALGGLGSVDILINNAGISQPLKLMDIAPENWELVIDVNLTGVLYLSQAFIPHMRTRGQGSIACMSSVSAQRGGGIFGGPHYSAAKAGVLGLAKAMARELGPDGIRVNSVTPGLIQTDITGGKLTPEMKADILKGIPLNRLGDTKDVANIYLFLASDLSAYVTGAVIDVNGGMLIH
jgi:NAD(P)-dependent dehydrogenase (short-subunit alcohol dehydrogenase family)